MTATYTVRTLVVAGVAVALVGAASELCAQPTPDAAVPTTRDVPPTTASEQTGLIRTFDELLEVLKADRAPHQPDKDGKPMVLIPTALAPIDGFMAIRWSASEGVVHFMQSMNLTVEADRLAAAYEAIARLNHGLPVSGLGIVSRSNEIYFRLTVPISPRGGITPEETRTYFRFTLQQAAQVHPVIEAVLEGKIEAEHVVRYYVASRVSASQQPIGRFRRKIGGSEWELIFDKSNNVALLKDGRLVVQSSSQFLGLHVTFLDRAGELAVPGSGEYSWKRDGDSLTFQLVNDSAKNRAGVLTDGPWTKIESPEQPAAGDKQRTPAKQ